MEMQRHPLLKKTRSASRAQSLDFSDSDNSITFPLPPLGRPNRFSTEREYSSFETLTPPLPLESMQQAHNQSTKSVCVDAITHPGLVRMHQPNEDSYLQIFSARYMPYRPPQLVGLFLVADGMGGHDYGKEASSFVVNAICSAIEHDLCDPQVSSDDLKKKFVQAVQQANLQLYQQNRRINVFRGTTLTGAILVEEPASHTNATASYSAYIVNVGDSRTYQYSPAKSFSRITRDHSVVEELVASGIITAEQRYTDSRRNAIYRCLGKAASLDVDVFSILLHPDDRLLLCSDGLWEMVRDPDLAVLLASPVQEPSVITSNLLQAALNRGGSDNITAIVIMVPTDANVTEC